jgi:hypothetical protein
MRFRIGQHHSNFDAKSGLMTQSLAYPIPEEAVDFLPTNDNNYSCKACEERRILNTESNELMIL